MITFSSSGENYWSKPLQNVRSRPKRLNMFCFFLVFFFFSMQSRIGYIKSRICSQTVSLKIWFDSLNIFAPKILLWFWSYFESKYFPVLEGTTLMVSFTNIYQDIMISVMKLLHCITFFKNKMLHSDFLKNNVWMWNAHWSSSVSKWDYIGYKTAISKNICLYSH